MAAPVDFPRIGEEIRREREALNLSQIGLAYKAGVSFTTIRRIEQGLVTPRPATLTVIRMALAAEAEEVAAT